MDNKTLITKFVFLDIDTNYNIIESICDEFEIDYDIYYEDDFTHVKLSKKPKIKDKMFWYLVYEVAIPKGEFGLFAAHLLNKYINKIKEFDLLYKNTEVDNE